MRMIDAWMVAAAMLLLLPVAPANGASAGNAAARPPTHGEFGASVDVRSRNMNPPRYPTEEARAGISGTTVLVIHVDAAGSAREVFVERSSGNANLDKAAIEAARTWTFQPGMEQGKAVEGRIRVPVAFDLGETFELDSSAPMPAWSAEHPIQSGAVECDRQLNQMLACAQGRLSNDAFALMLRHAVVLDISLSALTPAQKQEASKQCALQASAQAANQAALGCTP